MDTPQGISKAASWTMIGLGCFGAVSLTAISYTDTMKAQSDKTVSYAAEPVLPLNGPAPLNGPKVSPTTTTTYAASFAPQIHTRSHGS